LDLVSYIYKRHCPFGAGRRLHIIASGKKRDGYFFCLFCMDSQSELRSTITDTGIMNNAERKTTIKKLPEEN
jgi:hypothetical protein